MQRASIPACTCGSDWFPVVRFELLTGLVVMNEGFGNPTVVVAEDAQGKKLTYLAWFGVDADNRADM